MHTFKSRLLAAVTVVFIITLQSAASEAKPKLGDVSDGSRTNSAHVIDMRDEEGYKIMPDAKPVMPFSVSKTCGECHSYDKITKGWHFNATDPDVAPGRPGQPWILADSKSATVLPLSYRDWPGTYNPQKLGFSSWQFVEKFGTHMPGAGPGDFADVEEPDVMMRAFLSGPLEADCLGCHDAEASHSSAQYAAQVPKQNYRWASTAACGFAEVKGSAKSMPDTYDYLMPTINDNPSQKPPTVNYDRSRFNSANKVFFDIKRKPLNKRCYFCHSNKDIDGSEERNEDVHIAAGLACADCHRNGLDHNITRGYETEAEETGNHLAATASCKGCHLGDDSSDKPIAGRLGAPYPRHRHIPKVHFEKLACTACHSGPWPGKETIRTKTARAHKLGTFDSDKSDDALPHIQTPVFMKQTDGKIAPHKIIWPSFWAYMQGDDVTPVAPDKITSIAGTLLDPDKWSGLTEDLITNVLMELTSQAFAEGEPVYITGGHVYKLIGDKLITEDNCAAAPYAWPIAHDVRPASQSLGIRGCEDCHAKDAPFFFGKVKVDSPLSAAADFVVMQNFHGGEASVYEPVSNFFKWLVIIVMSLLVLHIAGDLFRRAIRAIQKKKN